MKIKDKIKNWLESDKRTNGHWKGCYCYSCRAEEKREKRK